METKFKFGDRVRLINDEYSDCGLKKGATDVIKLSSGAESDVCAVQFDGFRRGHGCGGVTPNQSGLWIRSRHIELVKPNKTVIRIIKDGDTTTAVEYNGKEVIRSASVTRYHSDEDNVRAATLAAVKKLYDVEKEKHEETPSKPTYMVGDIAQIVFKRPDGWVQNGEMDNYLGKIVKITRIGKNDFDFDFDGAGDWYFRLTDIDKLIYRDGE